jgi:hypothetical protein
MRSSLEDRGVASGVDEVDEVVDTFSYKKLFHPTLYAKVIAVLPGHKLFL